MSSDDLLKAVLAAAVLLAGALLWFRRSAATDTEDPYRSPESEAQDVAEIREVRGDSGDSVDTVRNRYSDHPR